MIARITGTLVDLQADTAHVEATPGVVYELLLPAFAVHRLGPSLGKPVTLHTLHFLESQNQGATFLPRLAGFLSPADKQFYQLLVTVKGIGNRRALRALVLPVDQLATAIIDRDIKLLQTMPEVGKKTAETIALTLRDKVDAFLNAPRSATPNDPDLADVPTMPTSSIARSAVEALVALGENRAQALAWVDQVMSSDDRPDTIEDVIAAVYRVKAG
ncbi:MAG: Holliday junction branch migration protein RuvA [Phycisphaeraceae bacterium]